MLVSIVAGGAGGTASSTCHSGRPDTRAGHLRLRHRLPSPGRAAKAHAPGAVHRASIFAVLPLAADPAAAVRGQRDDGEPEFAFAAVAARVQEKGVGLVLRIQMKNAILLRCPRNYNGSPLLGPGFFYTLPPSPGITSYTVTLNPFLVPSTLLPPATLTTHRSSFANLLQSRTTHEGYSDEALNFALCTTRTLQCKLFFWFYFRPV